MGNENGKQLANHVTALVPKMSGTLRKGNLRIACVGSVWKSWDFMKAGFQAQLHECGGLKRVTLVKLKVPMSVGACYMAAAKAVGADIQLKTAYEENCEQFYDIEF